MVAATEPGLPERRAQALNQAQRQAAAEAAVANANAAVHAAHAQAAVHHAAPRPRSRGSNLPPGAQPARRDPTNDYAALFVALIGEGENPQGVVNTSDGRVVRAFHSFTLVDQSGDLPDLIGCNVHASMGCSAPLYTCSHTVCKQTQSIAARCLCSAGSLCTASLPMLFACSLHGTVAKVPPQIDRGCCLHSQADDSTEPCLQACTVAQCKGRDLTKGRRRDQGAVKISCARQDPNARNCHGYRKFVKRSVLENPANGCAHAQPPSGWRDDCHQRSRALSHGFAVQYNVVSASPVNVL